MQGAATQEAAMIRIVGLVFTALAHMDRRSPAHHPVRTSYPA